ncbi:MAG: hypothetical protein R2813_07285 [Flavobacteriales bacterium]
MKNQIFLISTAAVLMFSSCSHEKYTKEIEDLKVKLIALKIETDRNAEYITDSLEWELNRNLNEIELDINNVLEKNGVIVGEDGTGIEHHTSTKEEIIRRVQTFSELLTHNRNKIDHLITKLEKAESNNDALIASLEKTKLRLEKQERTMEELFVQLQDERSKYGALDVGFRMLKAQNDSLSHCLGELDQKLHTGYLVVGDFRELKEKGVLSKDGGLFTLGAAHVLDNDFNERQFSQVDIREKVKVNVGARKAELITEHPTNSYEFKLDGKEVSYLEIKDPQEFWRASKYMVLEVN